MDNRENTEESKKPDNEDVKGTAGPVIIPTAAAAFVGALVGAIVGSQM